MRKTSIFFLGSSPIFRIFNARFYGLFSYLDPKGNQKSNQGNQKGNQKHLRKENADGIF